jgi:predicted RNase H-like nuclease (RuvC/YqgF family)
MNIATSLERLSLGDAPVTATRTDVMIGITKMQTRIQQGTLAGIEAHMECVARAQKIMQTMKEQLAKQQREIEALKAQAAARASSRKAELDAKDVEIKTLETDNSALQRDADAEIPKAEAQQNAIKALQNIDANPGSGAWQAWLRQQPKP